LFVLPGGLKGAQTFASSTKIHQLLHQFDKENKLIGIICASPIVMKAASFGFNRSITSHPSVKTELDQHYNYLQDNVVVDGNLVTSRGPGTSFLFALKLVELLCGVEVYETVRGPLMIPTLQ
jgi:protein DJ-1